MSTIILQDSFTDINGTLLSAHIPEIGSWVRDTGVSGGATGNIDIQSNKASSTSITSGIYKVNIANFNDMSIEFIPTQIPDTGSSKICIRYTDSDNYYAIFPYTYNVVFPAPFTYVVFKRVAGVTSANLITSSTVYTSSTVFKFEVSGTNINVYLNGILDNTIVDTSILSGIPALFINSSPSMGPNIPCIIDSVVVLNLASSASTLIKGQSFNASNFNASVGPATGAGSGESLQSLLLLATIGL